VEKKKYDLCLEVLKRLHDTGVLDNIILIGSWCLYFYKNNVLPASFSYTLRTRDIDFLVPIPTKLKKKVDVPELLEDLGFVEDFVGPGYLRLGHPDLIVEFLVPEKAKGTDKPYPLPQLCVNAQALRYLGFLVDNPITVKVDKMKLIMPHPIAFALHKLLILKKRKTDKAEKDVEQALSLLDHYIWIKQTDEITRIFKTMHKKWQKKVIESLRSINRLDIIQLLTQ
jgi:hypothetical protein